MIGNKLEREIMVLKFPHYIEIITLAAIDKIAAVGPQEVANFFVGASAQFLNTYQKICTCMSLNGQ